MNHQVSSLSHRVTDVAVASAIPQNHKAHRPAAKTE